MSTRNLVAVSIKHSEFRWKFGMPCWLWGERTAANSQRSFAGYTVYPNDAEVYTLEDFANKYSDCPWIKFDSPVSMCMDFCKKYKEYDTVLVPLDQYIKYCESAGLPLSRPRRCNNGFGGLTNVSDLQR